jgi:hypothetical protein
MNPEELHQHLITIADPDPGRRRGLAAAIAGGLWPGGTGDRTDPAALKWCAAGVRSAPRRSFQSAPA